MDISKLLSALENEDNETLLDLDMRKVSSIKNDILQKLCVPRDKLKKFHKQLKWYRYVDDILDIKYGSYIRWISLKDPLNIKLTKGGYICEIKVLDKGINLLCKNNMNKLFQISMDDNLIFQKLSEEELILLKSLEYLNKDD